MKIATSSNEICHATALLHEKKLDSRTTSIGISGQHGAGKTIFSQQICSCLAMTSGIQTLVISTDSYLVPDRSQREAILFDIENGRRPFADIEQAYSLNYAMLSDHIHKIRNHTAINRVPLYSRNSGTHSFEFEYIPNDSHNQILIIEGIWILHPEIREALDRIYILIAPENIRRNRVSRRANLAATPYEESSVRFDNLDKWTREYIRRNQAPSDIVIDNSEPEKKLVLDSWQDTL